MSLNLDQAENFLNQGPNSHPKVNGAKQSRAESNHPSLDLRPLGLEPDFARQQTLGQKGKQATAKKQTQDPEIYTHSSHELESTINNSPNRKRTSEILSDSSKNQVALKAKSNKISTYNKMAQIQEIQNFDKKIGYVYPRYGYLSQNVLESILTKGIKKSADNPENDPEKTEDKGSDTDDEIQQYLDILAPDIEEEKQNSNYRQNTQKITKDSTDKSLGMPKYSSSENRSQKGSNKNKLVKSNSEKKLKKEKE